MQSQRHGHHLRQADHGFTIVELLIVVVVIAILAAITIVAYNGITQRANDAAVQSGAEQAGKKVSTYAITNNDLYPSDLATVGITNSGTTTYQYSVNNSTNPAGYCVTVSSGNNSYYVGSNYAYTGSSSGTINQFNPASGACPGHSSSGIAITNYSEDPSDEVATNYGGAGSSTLARDTSTAHSGVASVRVTMPLNGSTGVVGIQFFNYPSLTTILAANTTYTTSAWVWVPSGTVDIRLSVQGGGLSGTPTNPPQRITSAKDQWSRIQNTFTTGTSGSISMYAVNNTATLSAGTQFWLDDIMVTQGTTLYNYADGNTAGWVWNGTAGVSTSTGPAV
jgi:prepilin-type N-terminal cleavage/methylation domain-containing protein